MATWVSWGLAVHVVGFVLWIMGMMRLASALGSHAAASPQEAKTYASLEGKLLWGGVVPGLVLALGSGLAILFAGYPDGFAHYKTQGWMHTKITLVVILIGISVYLGLGVRKLANSEPGEVSGVPYKAVHGIVGVLLIAIAILAKVRPF